MALQTCLPLSIDLWIWSIEPQLVVFTDSYLDVFWGGVKIPKPCGRATLEYLDEVKYNQPFWLSLSPMCLCGKLLYYVSLYEKDRRNNFVLREQNLIDFSTIPDNFEQHASRYYGIEDAPSPYLSGCSIAWPFDTRSSFASFNQQVNIWSFTSENAVGNMFDFHLFNPDALEIDCSQFSCKNREPGWYVSLVLLNSTPQP